MITTSQISNKEQLYFALGYCLFMVILAVIFLKFRPKKINYLHGYRTKRSKQNQETWDEANLFAARMFLKLTAICFLVPVLCYTVLPEYTGLITLMIHCLLLIALLPITEKHLKKHFDEEGNRRH